MRSLLLDRCKCAEHAVAPRMISTDEIVQAPEARAEEDGLWAGMLPRN